MNESQNNKSETMWWAIGGVGGVVMVAVALWFVFGGFGTDSNQAGVPSDLDFSTTRTTDQGAFEVSIEPDMDPLAINQLHQWQINVKTADGQPVDNANIIIGGGMPEHGHGLPTQPQVTESLGNGNYRVEGVRFNMAGWWEFKLTIAANGQSDNVTFNLRPQ